MSDWRGQYRDAVVARRGGPAGVEEQGKGTLEFSGNLGGPQNVLEQNDLGRMTRENNIAGVVQERMAGRVLRCGMLMTVRHERGTS